MALKIQENNHQYNKYYRGYAIVIHFRELYLFLLGLNALLSQVLHLILPSIIFLAGAFMTDLHLRQTYLFLNFLASASGNLAKINTSNVILGKLKNF